MSQRPATTANTEQARALLCGWQKTPGCTSTTLNCCGCALAPTPTQRPAEPTSPPPSPATVFELRAALDDFELRGHAALIDAARRIPANNAWPELARALSSLSEHSPRT